ncbi:hypothetical protein ACH42_13445 [Endozoicomonas sp. (ex Bugula neritina AB1)]|nr:hypothetical protein ACH42_13445 [Endozoicomonas sp. (ex Bugula neritina AB1)]
MPDLHKTGSYNVTKIATNPAVKVGFWTKVARFLGFKRVQAIEVGPKVPRGTYVAGDGTSIQDRTIDSVEITEPLLSRDPRLEAQWVAPEVDADSIMHAFIGYRANQENLERLKWFIIENGIGRAKEGEDNDYISRVHFALVASGLANYGEGGKPESRRLINGPITVKQFDRLKSLLDATPAKLTTELYGQKHISKKRIIRDSVFCKMLGASAGLSVFSSAEEFYSRQTLLRDYFVKGEGYDLLKVYGYSQADRLRSVWPQYNKMVDMIDDRKGAEDNGLAQINRYAKQGLRKSGTDALKVDGIAWMKNQKGEMLEVEKPYNKADPAHRFLALLQEVSSSNDGGYCQAMIQRYAVDFENPKAEKRLSEVRNMREVFSNIYSGAGHVVMKRAFPDEISDTKYTRVVLKNSREIFQWNSDLLQPRGGWKEDHDLLTNSEGEKIHLSK